MKQQTGKTFIVSLVSLLTVSLGATPALASPMEPATSTEVLASIGQQLNTEASLTQSHDLDTMLEVVDIDSAPSHGYNVEATIAAAEAEVGTSRPTGWSQPGECIISAKRWVHAGGGQWTGSGTPVSNYVGAARLTLDMVEPGDIIQYENLQAPNAWVMGVHTVLVTEVNDDGTFTIIESNNPYGSGLVTKKENWTPIPPAGFQAVPWRF
ncbi:CHAP domain-containing protein [Leucobacter chinensis]|uniref:CHAP domain-containing protein n=1 Tax=Leucobacter chinensis TaxID=2851010 RepID=UPI0020B86EB4|nr:CHAP domain-containing protein [Leucobacter chinensis]